MLTHIPWGFYLNNSNDVAPFVWMTWFNLWMCLYTFIEVKVAVWVILWALGSVCIFPWMCIFNSLGESWDWNFKIRQRQQESESDRDQQSSEMDNRHNWMR